MEELDGDDVRLSYRGKQAARDIVQVSKSASHRSNIYQNSATDKPVVIM